MEFVTLNNGVKMPILGYGVYQTPPEETKKCVLYKPENLLYTVFASRGTDPPRSKNPNHKGISNEHFQKAVRYPQK